MTAFSLEINGEERRVDVDAYRPLREVLRYDLGLTGTKESCLVPVCKAEGAEITTIEGLAEDGVLSDVQQSFVDCFASQCGYCIPGFIMASTALLEENPDPSVQEIREGLSGNLCRCTGYVKIIDAVRDAAEKRA